MNKAMQQQFWSQYLDLVLNCKNRDELNRLFNFMLTFDEREMLAKRIALTEALLKKEKPQRQIAEDLSMSIAFITRGSNELKRTSEEDKEQIKKWLKIKD
jgi:TrpR family trp operon transcriptional repressor